MKLLIFLLLALFCTFAKEPQEILVRSLNVYSDNNPKNFPLINKNSLNIDFDIESEILPSLQIIFKLCDANWNIYDNPLLVNSLNNTDYNIELIKVDAYYQNYNYTFKGVYPSDNVSFPFQGKWKFFVTDLNNDENIYAEGKFFVADSILEIFSDFSKYNINSRDSEKNLNRSIELKVHFELADYQYKDYIESVEIIKNRLIDEPYISAENEKFRFFEWDGNRKLTYFFMDIYPGNEYRVLDIRDDLIHPAPETKASLDRFETSRIFKLGKSDHNGSFKVLGTESQFAEYIIVNFNLSTDENKEDIFISGSFTDWQVLPVFKMSFKDGIYSKRLKIKRGIYDYHYVKGTTEGNLVMNIDREVIEGNFWETKNDYYLFVIYKDQEKLYDRIIGFKKIIGKSL